MTTLGANAEESAQQQDAAVRRNVFNVPEHLINGSFSLDFERAEEDPTNYTFDIPFISHIKGERPARMADWTAESSSHANAHPAGGLGGQPNEEDGQWSFASFIESGKVAAGRRNSRSGPSFSQPNSSFPSRGNQFGTARKYGWSSTNFNRRIIRDPSVSVETDWKLVDEVEFSRLSKLSFAPSDEPRTVLAVGSPLLLDPLFDRLQARQERPLGFLEFSPHPTSSIAGDHSLGALIAEQVQAGQQVIVSSDCVLSMLMSSSRTVFPWDIFIAKHPEHDANVLVIDKRDASAIDDVQVNETKPEGLSGDEVVSKDSINSPGNLSIEASRITANLPHLLSSSKAAPSLKTKYVVWNMGDRLTLLVRTQVNASVDKEQDAVLRGLLEYEWGRGAMDWRQRLDAQRASTLALELKNNSAQVARWVYSAVLAAVQHLKIAFVSRINPRDRTRHAILGVHDLEPYEFANQMGIDLSNGFGIVKALALRCLSGDLQQSISATHRVVIMRDPQKPILRVYQVPAV